MLNHERSHSVTRHQPKSAWQRHPNLLSQLCMPRLPSLHATTTDVGTNAPEATSAILIKLGDLKHSRPQLRGTDDVIENLLVSFQCCRASRGARRTIRCRTRVRTFWSKNQTVGLIELHSVECHESSDRGSEDLSRERGAPW